MSPCPSENSLIMLLGKKLDSPTRQKLHAHIRVCERCFSAVADIAATTELSSGDSVVPQSTSVDAPMLAIGSMFKERFELLQPLGHGCFGNILLAQDAQNSHRKVAIKILKPQFLDTPEVVRRFNQEGASLELLTHPNIVRVYERGEWKHMYYIITEYIEGESLEDWLQRYRSNQQRPPWQLVMQIFRQLCEALAFAHGLSTVHGIIHRDLKPRNIMLTTRDGGPHVIVLDFGLARLGERSETLSAETIGTPGYMAPEQIGSQAEVGPWTDVYALGVILLEMLTLKNRTDDEKSFWVSALRDPKGLLRRLHKRRPDVPFSVLQVILRAINPQIQSRYSNARTFLDAIDKSQRRSRAASGFEFWTRNAILSFIVITNINLVQQVLKSIGNSISASTIHQIKDYAQRVFDTSTLSFNISNGNTHSEITLFQISTQSRYVSVSLRQGKEIYREDLMVSDLRKFQRREMLVKALSLDEEINIQVIVFGKKHHLAESSKYDPLYLGHNQQVSINECLDGLCRLGPENPGTNKIRRFNGVWCDRYNIFIGGSNLKIQRYNSLERFPWSTSSESNYFVTQIFGESVHNLFAVGGCRLNGEDCPYPPGTDRNRLLKWDPDRKIWDSLTIPELPGQLWYAYPLKNGELWIVGETTTHQGMIVYRDGQGKWQPPIILDLPESKLSDIWKAGQNSIWAVGGSKDNKGVLLHTDRPLDFLPVDELPTKHPLSAIWGTSDKNFWLGTNDGLLFHHEGQNWTQAPCAPQVPGADINVLSGRNDQDIWAVGGKSFLAQYDGSCWNRLKVPYQATHDKGPTSLNGLFINQDSVCVVSGSGDVFQYRYAAPNPQLSTFTHD